MRDDVSSSFVESSDEVAFAVDKLNKRLQHPDARFLVLHGEETGGRSSIMTKPTEVLRHVGFTTLKRCYRANRCVLTL